MNIQLSTAGLLIFLLFYIATAVVLILLSAFIGPKRWKWAVILPLAVAGIVAPWVDEILTARNFMEVCRDAGASYSQPVEVKGFLNATSQASLGFVKPRVITDPGSVLNFDRAGYQFTESLLTNGSVLHFERVDDGIKVSVLDHPRARFKFARPVSDADAGRAASCSEDTIVDLELNKTIARYRYCKRYASFPERIWLSLLHGGPIEECPTGSKRLNELLYRYVLIPKRQS